MQINAQKSALRVQFRQLRAAWTDEERKEMHRSLTAAVTALPSFQDRQTALLCYASLGDEVRTWDVLQAAWQCGKTVALPRCERGGRMAFYRVAGKTRLKKGMLGIFEPNEDCPLYTPVYEDICIVPALAFDRSGNRLGYGGGYYDRYLASHPLFTVGICYPNGLTKQLPTEPYDIPVQQVICCDVQKEA